MDELRKRGQMYIKFDENNELEYGFQVQGRNIERFLNLSDREVSKVILPDICDEEPYSPEYLKYMIEHNKGENRYLSSKILKPYIKGQIRILAGCFEGSFKKAEQPIEIIVPFEHSLLIDHEAFDDDTKPKFILKNGMQIFTINRAFDTYFSYEHEFWTLIARKEISNLNYTEYQEDYSVSEQKDYSVSTFECD